MSEDSQACLIIIGDEVLSGRTQDLNLAYIGRRCDELGITLAEARIIEDDEDRIVACVNECRALYTYVFTTGGIGPTHDDITSASIAKAFSRKLIRHPDAVEAMDDYYDTGMLTEARLKMAEVPEGASLIDNPVSAAPGFQIENVYVLPGVPMIMQAMFEIISDTLQGGEPMLSESIASNLGESVMAQALAGLQQQYADVAIGSYPYFKKGKLGVNLVMRSRDAARLAELGRRLQSMIVDLGGEVVG
ncbi:MAG: competence/damage-inducible protein A [Gammaproteobacteria bacterium]|nr:competence/damage-inducible protein A [Gammaproteobacteria bacterium]